MVVDKSLELIGINLADNLKKRIKSLLIMKRMLY